MKISEAMLRIIQEAGGEIGFTQWQKWEGQLIDSGFLENVYRDTKDGFTCFVRLTDKGRTFLERK